MSDTPTVRFVLGENNVWAFPLDGGGWVLVDAGLEYLEDCVSSWEVLGAQMRAAGCAPEEVRAVIVTHEHIDHAGLAARWARQGTAVIAMPEALPMLAAGYPAYAAIRARRLEEMDRHGCPPQVQAAILGALRAHGTHALGWPGCPREALVPARDGDTFALRDGRTLHLLAAPGHTPGNLVVFVQDAEGAGGDLCSGDTLLPTTVPTPGLQFPGLAGGDVKAPRWPSLPPYLRSVERLRRLHLRRILPGHGEVVADPDRLFTQFEDHHARRARRVRAHLARAGAAGDTAYGVVRGLFPRLPEARIGQALTEIIGHLDVLVERGEATQDRDRGRGRASDAPVRTRATSSLGEDCVKC